MNSAGCNVRGVPHHPSLFITNRFMRTHNPRPPKISSSWLVGHPVCTHQTCLPRTKHASDSRQMCLDGTWTVGVRYYSTRRHCQAARIYSLLPANVATHDVVGGVKSGSWRRPVLLRSGGDGQPDTVRWYRIASPPPPP